MISVFDYFSYREFLRDYYKERKERESFFSYRYMSYKLGIDHSLLVKIFLGKRHISEKAITSFIRLCGFTKREAQYFDSLVHYEKARSEKQQDLYLEKMLALKGYGSEKLEKYQYEYFRKWYYSAVRSILGSIEFRGDYMALAKCLHPEITAGQAKKAVALLKKLDLVKKDNNGRYLPADAHITTGEKWRSLAVKEYQRQTIELSLNSLSEDPKEKRDISSVTMSVDRDAFEDIREIIRECRSEIIRRVDMVKDGSSDRIYQLNMQFIPVSTNLKDDDEDEN